jgi:hypothetical protein
VKHDAFFRELLYFCNWKWLHRCRLIKRKMWNQWGWILFIGSSTDFNISILPFSNCHILVICYTINQLLHADFTLTQPLHLRNMMYTLVKKELQLTLNMLLEHFSFFGSVWVGILLGCSNLTHSFYTHCVIWKYFVKWRSEALCA